MCKSIGFYFCITTSIAWKIYAMISLSVIPNLKCNSKSEYIKSIIMALALDACYMVPMIISYIKAHWCEL